MNELAERTVALRQSLGRVQAEAVANRDADQLAAAAAAYGYLHAAEEVLRAPVDNWLASLP